MTQEVDEKYLVQLDAIAQEMMESEVYALFLEEEEEEAYKTLCDTFEPAIAAVHREVADNDPLQLEAFEQLLLHPELQGLYSPRILGYALLRGEVNEQYKYKRPQQHFKDILMAICHSTNLDFLRKRIGQAVQVGFALSSDIWITDLVNVFPNKRVRQYLQSQKLERYRDVEDRKVGYKNFLAQLSHENYQTTVIPADFPQLKVHFSEVMHFLMHRVKKQLPDQNVRPAIEKMLANPAFAGTTERKQILTIYLNFFGHDEASWKVLSAHLNEERKDSAFANQYLSYLTDYASHEGLLVSQEQDELIMSKLDPKINDVLLEFYQMVVQVHTFGFVHPESMEKINHFYVNHQGVSAANDYLRTMISSRFVQFITHLDAASYHDFMDIFKTMQSFMHLFGNEAFNKTLKLACMNYAKLLLKTYPERKSKEYLEIRRFAGAAYREAKFMTDREIVDFFKKEKVAKS